MCLCAWSDQSDTAQHQPELSPCLSLPLWQGILKLKTEGLSETEIFLLFYIVEMFPVICCGESECPDFFFFLMCVCLVSS